MVWCLSTCACPQISEAFWVMCQTVQELWAVARCHTLVVSPWWGGAQSSGEVTDFLYVTPMVCVIQRIGLLRGLFQQWNQCLYKNYTPQSAPLQHLKVKKFVSKKQDPCTIFHHLHNQKQLIFKQIINLQFTELKLESELPRDSQNSYITYISYH